MRQKHRSRFLGFCLLLSALLSCSYQLQPPLKINGAAQPIYIEGDRAFAISLKRKLEQHGIALSHSRENAGSVIRINNIHHDTRDYALSADSRLAEQRHHLQAHLSWHYRNSKNESGDSILLDRNFSSERIQLLQPEHLSAQQRETTQLIEILRDQISNRMLDAMRHLNTQ